VRRVAVALLHHPVLGRGGEVLTTTLTNLDLHDMARSVRTYGLQALYAVHPYPSQRLLAERIRRHWVEGAGGKRIPDRAVALAVLEIVPDLTQACARLGGEQVELWTTAARATASPVTRYADARRALEGDGPPVMLCFGTGWGLAPALIERADVRLEPIHAARDSAYNHLSVRAACAITLDRLFG
jgi:hypothetical protein